MGEDRIRGFPWIWAAFFIWVLFILFFIGFLQGNSQNLQYISLLGFFGIITSIPVIEYIYNVRTLTKGIERRKMNLGFFQCDTNVTVWKNHL